jgi:hypothetical protein
MISIAKTMIGSAIRTTGGALLGNNEAKMLAYTTAVLGLLSAKAAWGDLEEVCFQVPVVV